MNDLIIPADLVKQLAGANPPLVVDVRDAEQYAAGHIAGAIHIPSGQLAGKLAGIPKTRAVVTY
jgi:rhodanese-related sulfurtransferase